MNVAPASRTRHANVPAVTAKCPIERPPMAGRTFRWETGGIGRQIENSPASSTSVGNPSTSSGITSPSFTRSGWTFCFTYTFRARASLDMPRTVFRPMPTPTTFGFVVGVRPSRSRPMNWHSPTTFASSGFAIHFPRSERLEGPRDDDLDRDFLEGFREGTEDLRAVLLHVDADAFLAVLLAYSDANNARHLHH